MSESLPNEVRFDLWHHQACTCVAVPQPSVQGQWVLFTDYDALRAERDALKEQLDVAERSLRIKGYRKQCDIAACNCGAQWNHGGLANDRLREVVEALPYQNGGTVLSRVEVLVKSVTDLMRRLSECEQARVALKALVAHIDLITYRDGCQLRLGEGVPAYDNAKQAAQRFIEEYGHD